MAEASTKSPKVSKPAQPRAPKPLGIVRDLDARKREVREAIVSTLA